jgi:branched-chain amino acid transport system permease protein
MAATDTSAPVAHAMADARARAVAFMARRHRFRIWEAVPWLLASAAFFLFPDRMAFGSQVLLMALFTLSLDLILGFAGIVSLGHAAFFGLGAYTAALLTLRGGWEEQISGLVAAAVVAAVAGAASGALLLRYRGITLLVLTLSTTIMLQELGNVLRDLTGGYDGLPGLAFKPLLGLFDYDLYGHVAYLYALAVLFVLFVAVRTIVYSPFGQTLAGIRENVARMHAIGSPVHLRLVVVYTIAAAIAGVAGALFTQTNQYVTLGVFDFDNSAGVMVMLILGGTGRLYGAFVGAVIYMVLQDYVSKLKLTVWGLAVDGPQYWQFAVGLLLVLTVLFARRGLLGLLEDAAKMFVRERKP